MKRFPEDKLKEFVLLAVCLSLAMVLAYYLTGQPNLRVRSDHFSRWYASQKLIAEGRSIYDSRNGQEVMALNSFPTAPVEGSFFYPAHLLLLTLPLVWLPYPVAHFIWLVVIQGFSILAIFLLIKTLGWPRNPNHMAVLMVFSILFIPNLQNTVWGQFNSVGMISLVLTIIALRKGTFFTAGLLALGMTFKPQNMLLTLGFLIIWAASQRSRWGFLLGFVGVCLGAGLFAELLEPHWVASFFQGVWAYANFLQPESVLTHIQAGIAGVGVIFIAGLFVVFQTKNQPADSLPFTLGVAFSLTSGWLVIPLFGMIQLAAMPLAVILLLSVLRHGQPTIFNIALFTCIFLYLSGLAGLIYGLSRPELYGLHLQYSELAYKTWSTILLTLFSSMGVYLTWRQQIATSYPQV